MDNDHHMKLFGTRLTWVAGGVLLSVLSGVLFTGQVFAQERSTPTPTPTPTPTLIDISESVTIGSGPLDGIGELVPESVAVGSGVLGGMGELLTESVKTRDEAGQISGEINLGIPDANESPSSVGKNERTEVRNSAPVDDVPNTRVEERAASSDAESRDERGSRSSPDPFSRATGRLSEPEPNRWLPTVGMIAFVGLIAIAGIILLRRRRAS